MKETSTLNHSPMSIPTCNITLLEKRPLSRCHPRWPQSPVRGAGSHCCPTIVESTSCGCFHPFCKHRESTHCLPINCSDSPTPSLQGSGAGPTVSEPCTPFHRLCRHCEQRAQHRTRGHKSTVVGKPTILHHLLNDWVIDAPKE